MYRLTVYTYIGKKLLYIKGNDKVKKQLTQWERIFAHDIADRGIIPKIHKMKKWESTRGWAKTFRP